jgi:hypothetical protein
MVRGGEQAALSLPDGPALTDDLVQRRPMVELGAGEEEHVLGPLDRPAGVELSAQAQRAAAQQRPGQGEPAGLLLAEGGIALGDLDQGQEPGLQRRPVGQGGGAAGGQLFAVGSQLTVAVGGLGWLPAELPGGRVGPVDTLDRIGWEVGLGAGQAGQQLLDAAADRAGQVLADEAGQGALHLPGRPSDYRQRPQVLPGQDPDRIHQPDQLLGVGRLDLLLALLDRVLVAGQQLLTPLLGQAVEQPPVGGHRVAARAQDGVAQEPDQPPTAGQQGRQ